MIEEAIHAMADIDSNGVRERLKRYLTVCRFTKGSLLYETTLCEPY